MTFEDKSLQFFWQRREKPATEPVETGSRFVKLSACLFYHILLLLFVGSPRWACFLNQHHKLHLLKPQSSDVDEFPAGSLNPAYGSHS